jgi:glycosyltransferase involved in cell wall biosynthesis
MLLPAKLCVVLTTYNHERYIREALDSILGQETNFEFEVVISEDSSTDRTRDIVIEYQAANPSKIRLVLAERNKCDNGAFMEIIRSNQCAYISLLDGDDYWTSRFKLQKQVDYLDSHPECSICFHNVRIVSDNPGHEETLTNPQNQPAQATLEDLLDGCFIFASSVMLRRESLAPFPEWYVHDNSADWTFYVLAAMNGDIAYLNETLSVYRYHPGGFWTSQPTDVQEARIIEFYENIATLLPVSYCEAIKSRLLPRYYELFRSFRSKGDLQSADLYMHKLQTLEPDARKVKWELRCARGNRACVVYPAADDTIRVEIETAVSAPPWDVQLNQAHFTVEAYRSYAVRLRARAEESRKFCVGVSRAHEPWSGLGLYETRALTHDWQELELRFVCDATDDNARIHFDLGGSDIAVEFAAVRLDSV